VTASQTIIHTAKAIYHNNNIIVIIKFIVLVNAENLLPIGKFMSAKRNYIISLLLHLSSRSTYVGLILSVTTRYNEIKLLLLLLFAFFGCVVVVCQFYGVYTLAIFSID
jgi:hypothetical protein